MGGLFGSKSNTSTTESDPFKNMPRWMRKALEKDAGFRQDLLKQGGKIADEMGENPREILGLGEDELLGRDMILEGSQGADELAQIAAGRLGRDYESEYTDDVVDTTLAGIQRQHERDRLAREGRAAAVGGTSNSRAAVGEAVAENLTGMTMADMEAKLRDDAFRFDATMGLEEAGLADTLANSELSRGLQSGGALGMIGEKERGLDQAQLDEDRTSEQQALSWLGNLFSGTNTGYGPTGSSQTSTTPAPSTFSQILGAGASVAGGFLAGSDERGKEDVTDLGTPALDKLSKVEAKEYKYKDDFGHTRKRTTGLMAQDLERAGIEGAVHEDTDGMKIVDAYPVLATVVQAVKELDARTAQ